MASDTDTNPRIDLPVAASDDRDAARGSSDAIKAAISTLNDARGSLASAFKSTHSCKSLG